MLVIVIIIKIVVSLHSMENKDGLLLSLGTGKGVCTGHSMRAIKIEGICTNSLDCFLKAELHNLSFIKSCCAVLWFVASSTELPECVLLFWDLVNKQIRHMLQWVIWAEQTIARISWPVLPSCYWIVLYLFLLAQSVSLYTAQNREARDGKTRSLSSIWVYLCSAGTVIVIQ